MANPTPIEKVINLVVHFLPQGAEALGNAARAAIDAVKGAINDLLGQQRDVQRAADSMNSRTREKQDLSEQAGPARKEEDDKRLAGVRKETQEAFDAAREDRKRTAAKMDPDVLNQQAAIELRNQAAKQAYNRALEAEKERQAPTVKAASSLGDIGKDTASGAYQALQKGNLGGVLQSIVKGVTAAVGEVGTALGGFGAALIAVAPEIIGVAVATMGAAAILKSLSDQIAGLAGAASPATLMLYQRAWKDFWAVIGRDFIPLAELATQVVRFLGDALANILPSTQQVRQALAPLQAALQELRSSMGDMAPLVRLVLVEMLNQAAIAIRLLAAQITLMIQASKLMPGYWMMALVDKAMGGANQTSVNAAPQQSSYVGLFELGEQARLKAFSSTGVSPEVQQVDLLKQIQVLIAKIADEVPRLVAKIADEIPGLGLGRLVGGLSAAIGGAR